MRSIIPHKTNYQRVLLLTEQSVLAKMYEMLIIKHVVTPVKGEVLNRLDSFHHTIGASPTPSLGPH